MQHTTQRNGNGERRAFVAAPVKGLLGGAQGGGQGGGGGGGGGGGVCYLSH